MFKVLYFHEEDIIIPFDARLLLVFWSPLIIIIIPWASILLEANGIPKLYELLSYFALFIKDFLGSKDRVSVASNKSLVVS